MIENNLPNAVDWQSKARPNKIVFSQKALYSPRSNNKRVLICTDMFRDAGMIFNIGSYSAPVAAVSCNKISFRKS